MTTIIHLKGALEPVELNEPFEATVLNMSAAQNNNLRFFMGTNRLGQREAIHIEQILRMIEVEDD